MILPGRNHRYSAAAADRDRMERQETNQQSFLLKLPAEIRNQIYGLLVPRGTQVGICSPRGMVNQCPLLAVCRQIQIEVMPMYFGSNTFTILLRSFAKRSHGPWHRKSHRSFSENAFASIQRFQVVNNHLCRTGRQRLPHCLHLDGVVVMIDRKAEIVTACKPICNSGISLVHEQSPHPFAIADERPCYSPCCLKARKESEDRLVASAKAIGLHFRHRNIAREDLVDVGTSKPGVKVWRSPGYLRRLQHMLTILAPTAKQCYEC